MLNIIINLEKDYSSKDSIIQYIKHINNINNNNISINIYLINCIYDNTLISNINNNSILNKDNIKNINVYVYTFEVEFNDNILNNIIDKTEYNYILFTKLNTYLTYDFIDWIQHNELDNNCFYRSNIFELNSISNLFFESYNDNIYYDIINNLNTNINEYGINNIDNEKFINNFNNNPNINIYDYNNIISNNLYYLHYINDFLILHKNIFKKEGFYLNNNNYDLSLQYFIYNLIKNKYNMYILPYKISSYKLFDNTINNKIIDLNLDFQCSIDYNKFLNYKIYDIINNKIDTYIRNQIKTYKGYNPTKTIYENSLLKNKNEELIRENDIYKNNIYKNNNKINYYFYTKWSNIYISYNKLCIYLTNAKKKYISINKIYNI